MFLKCCKSEELESDDGRSFFGSRFQNPIENGQHADSTSKDVRLMKQRAHVLHKQVKGFVQRKNMAVLKDELPSKCVYVISVRLSNLQRKLYTQFLHSHGLLSNPLENNGRRSILFNAYHALAKVSGFNCCFFVGLECIFILQGSSCSMIVTHHLKCIWWPNGARISHSGFFLVVHLPIDLLHFAFCVLKCLALQLDSNMDCRLDPLPFLLRVCVSVHLFFPDLEPS